MTSRDLWENFLLESSLKAAKNGETAKTYYYSRKVNEIFLPRVVINKFAKVNKKMIIKRSKNVQFDLERKRETCPICNHDLRQNYKFLFAKGRKKTYLRCNCGQILKSNRFYHPLDYSSRKFIKYFKPKENLNEKLALSFIFKGSKRPEDVKIVKTYFKVILTYLLMDKHFNKDVIKFFLELLCSAKNVEDYQDIINEYKSHLVNSMPEEPRSESKTVKNYKDSLNVRISHKNVRIKCPICGQKKKIKISPQIINYKIELTPYHIPEGLICEHTFIVYLDKQLNVKECKGPKL